MADTIIDIFNNNIKVIEYSDKTITYLRLQNFYKALDFSAKAIDMLMKTIENIISNQMYFNEYETIVDVQNINYILENLLMAQENRDYILLADFYEMQLNPFIVKLQEIIVGKETFDFTYKLYNKNVELIAEKDFELGKKLKNMPSPLKLLKTEYTVENTSCGLMTLAIGSDREKYYLHSNGQVLHEGGVLAREWFDDNISEYIVYGYGFGYHILELMELDDSISIDVYEGDINVIQLACAFTDMSKILMSDRVHLIYDPSFNRLKAAVNNLNDEIKYVIHYPSLRNIKDISIRESLEDYFVTYSSVNNQLHKLNNNFKNNLAYYDEYVDVLYKDFNSKDIYIIAAGPSLDKNFKELKKIGNNGIILSTGTVIKKLLMAGINPDYAIITDANQSVFNQIKDINTSKVPLLFLSTVYYKVPEKYIGKKYLICQKGFKKAEKFAYENHYNLYQTGGSVSTTALSLGIHFKCKRIIFVGLDLAYTNNMDHAKGTDSVNFIEQLELRQIEDIYGNVVNTGKNLDIYRKWIERQIKGVEEIEFIDATEGGARIKGTKVMKLSDCISG